MNLLELSEQEIIRRNSMEQLRQMGIEPYPAAEYVTNAFSKEIKETFKDDAEPRPVSIAGRIMSRRIMGKASLWNYRIPRVEYRSISPVTIFARMRIRTPTMSFSRNYWISVISSGSRDSFSVLRWERFRSCARIDSFV